jgi:hypothetical protein
MKKPCYRASTLPLMQTMLATLAGLEFAHERELERVAASSADTVLKARRRGQLEARYRERREPYIQQLGALEARIKVGMPEVSRSSRDQDAA